MVTLIFKWMMFQSITSLTSHYYNVSEDQVTWLAQVSMVSMCVTLIPTTLLSEARSFIGPFDQKTKIGINGRLFSEPGRSNLGLLIYDSQTLNLHQSLHYENSGFVNKYVFAYWMYFEKYCTRQKFIRIAHVWTSPYPDTTISIDHICWSVGEPLEQI